MKEHLALFSSEKKNGWRGFSSITMAVKYVQPPLCKVNVLNIVQHNVVIILLSYVSILHQFLLNSYRKKLQWVQVITGDNVLM